MCAQLIVLLIVSGVLGSKMNRIGYSGILWFLATFFGGFVAFVLATSLPNRNLDLLRSSETELLDKQLVQASLPVTDGAAVIPRRTISDDLTRFADA
jgi:hypothetical protein